MNNEISKSVKIESEEIRISKTELRVVRDSQLRWLCKEYNLVYGEAYLGKKEIVSRVNDNIERLKEIKNWNILVYKGERILKTRNGGPGKQWCMLKCRSNNNLIIAEEKLSIELKKEDRVKDSTRLLVDYLEIGEELNQRKKAEKEYNPYILGDIELFKEEVQRTYCCTNGYLHKGLKRDLIPNASKKIICFMQRYTEGWVIYNIDSEEDLNSMQLGKDSFLSFSRSNPNKDEKTKRELKIRGACKKKEKNIYERFGNMD